MTHSFSSPQSGELVNEHIILVGRGGRANCAFNDLHSAGYTFGNDARLCNTYIAGKDRAFCKRKDDATVSTPFLQSKPVKCTCYHDRSTYRLHCYRPVNFRVVHLCTQINDFLQRQHVNIRPSLRVAAILLPTSYTNILHKHIRATLMLIFIVERQHKLYLDISFFFTNSGHIDIIYLSFECKCCLS